MATPVWKTKFGSVEVAAWERQSEKYGNQISFSMSKSYKDKKGNWVNQTFYFSSVTEMLNTIQAVQEALAFKFKKSDAEQVEDEPVDDLGV